VSDAPHREAEKRASIVLDETLNPAHLVLSYS
jgi:hypothetical protein